LDNARQVAYFGMLRITLTHELRAKG